MRSLGRSGALAGLGLWLLLASCSDTSSAESTDTALYTAVIRRVATGESTELPEMVFVETLPGAELSLSNQTSIVKALDDATDVRFIDDEQEAIDDAQPAAPVRHSGVLVRLGIAERTDGTARVKATRYVDRSHQEPLCVEVRQAGDGWETVSATRC